ncbi:hypothetical protein D9V30_04555 [Mycetocola reblochoni]|uniref:Uncharacterized protein n=1 Tax=Mycetocola reblochoni TaxID=331618 RepID=A0A3L6ZPW0_9MICO|nr:hypothetical protein D9V30_04555 [Mycetocola reblochoni]
MSPEARTAVFTAAVLFVSIVVAAVLATALTRRSVKRLLAQREREQRAAAIGTLIDASTEAAVWNSLTQPEQVLVDRAIGQADIHVRLLPVKGAQLAADWAAHQLAELKRHSATYGSDLGPVVHEFRDRLLEWQAKPGRARKIFEDDLERWQFDRTGDASAASVFPTAAPAPTATQVLPGSAPATAATHTTPVEESTRSDSAATTVVTDTRSASQTEETAAPASTTATEATAATETLAARETDSPQRLLDDVAALEGTLPERDDSKPDPL